MVQPAGLEAWIARQARYSAFAMERALSATGLCRRREAFGQAVTPARGSVLASPVMADWDPEPDYFFHWLRDSAIVMRTVADLMGDAEDEAARARWRRHFADFVRFSLSLARLDGAAFLARSGHRRATRRRFRAFLRPDGEIRALAGDKLLGEPRFNADGTIDVLRWSRPQYDGPALRALACLRFVAAGGPLTDELARLLRLDLDFTVRYADRPCIGPWEEPGAKAHYYYVALVQLGALVHGRAWAEAAPGREWQAAERRLRAGLERHWSDRHRVYKAVRHACADSADGLVDAALLLAVLDADLPTGRHSVLDERVQVTEAAIESLFAREFPINRVRPAGHGPAMGRWREDRYFGGGAWYPTTLAAAGYCYRLAQELEAARDTLIRRGDAFMATVRDLTPADGALSEQVDRASGAQTSARHLTWSYAAFVNAARLRAQATGTMGAFKSAVASPP